MYANVVCRDASNIYSRVFFLFTIYLPFLSAMRLRLKAVQ